ncbi:MAG: glycine oxidase ThiO [Cyanobacteria bacterium P01_A01_bin.17]
MNSSADILIIGGGAMGLATAIELARQDRQVTVLSRSFKEAAVHAAAGMLAPQAEGLAASPMLDLCLQSRSMYPDWIQKLEELTGLDAGYWPCGILSPLYELPTGHSLHASDWLQPEALNQQQPGLSAEVKGGWWFPNDAQVNNRALAQVLYAAAQQLGVKLCDGVTVEKIQHDAHRITQVETTVGTWQAQMYVLTTGAWSADLLPVPVFPRKGQLLSVKAQPHAVLLNQVLFGSEIYLVPRQEGQIVVGATSEDVGFAPHNTPAGIQQLLTAATRLFPGFADYVMEEFWWGFRPTTPDELPILGASPYENLVLATGHYRNGILLTPITAALIAQLVLTQTTDPLLESFSWERFDSLERQHDALATAT